MALPNKKYSIIYADPPWKYNARNNKNTKFGGGAGGHYPLMTTKEICDMKIQDITAPNCALLLWATFPRLKDALQVMEAWGFEYKTIGINWIKTNKNNGKIFFGIGYYFKSNSEVCLLGIKGKMKPITNSESSILISRRENHSKKPDVVRDKIVGLFGDIPRVELFARDSMPGWDVWGSDINKLETKG